MPGITNPAEEYFKDGLWGWVSTAWKKLVATAGGALHIQFAGQEADVEVTQTAAADLTPGVCGWDGNSWQKLPMLWGYSGVYAEVVSELTAVAPDDSINGTAVDPGEVWVVKGLSAQDANNAFTTLTLGFNHDGAWHWVKRQTTIAVGEIVVWDGEVILDAGDYVHASFAGVTANDDLYLYVWGYKMKVAE